VIFVSSSPTLRRPASTSLPEKKHIMNLSIESKIIAIVEADALDRLPALVLSHAKQDGAAAIRWATKDEFGQPILFRILESGDFDVISELLPLIEGSVFETLRFATFSPFLLGLKLPKSHQLTLCDF
jgi:hypothetical protein